MSLMVRLTTVSRLAMFRGDILIAAHTDRVGSDEPGGRGSPAYIRGRKGEKADGKHVSPHARTSVRPGGPGTVRPRVPGAAGGPAPGLSPLPRARAHPLGAHRAGRVPGCLVPLSPRRRGLGAQGPALGQGTPPGELRGRGAARRGP